jgi:GTP cyclohydrolase III
MSNKINRYREVQSTSFEEFFNAVTDTGVCECCDNYEECVQYIGQDNIVTVSGNGCSGFDSSIENIKKHFLLEKCVPIGT